MKGYKGFSKGMVCRGKQYAENTVYEEQGAAECCQEGLMHFCETPMYVLNYYPILDDNCEFNEFAEVEALDEVLTNGDKRAAKKLRIGAKLSIRDFIKAAVSVVIESTKPGRNDNIQAASGYGSQLAALGDGSQLAASGYGSKLAASGDGSQLAASGDRSKLAASGDGSQLAASGDGSQLAASGDRSQLALNGTNSVGAAIGYNSIAKGAIGNWIVLAEWKRNDEQKWYPACVKAGKIDGEALKPDTWYKLKNGEFVEVQDD